VEFFQGLLKRIPKRGGATVEGLIPSSQKFRIKLEHALARGRPAILLVLFFTGLGLGLKAARAFKIGQHLLNAALLVARNFH